MRRYISICFLWAICIALWGQSNGGYGGDYNPVSPDNPMEPSVTMKYHLKVTSSKGGSANLESSTNKFTAGTSVYIYANTNSGYKFKCWLQGDSIVSTSQWYYYTMPAKNVEIRAVFAFDPEVPGNPEVIPLDYKVTAEASPSRGGNVWYSNEEIKVGSYTYVSANAYSGYKFVGWVLDGQIVSTDSYYYFEMQARNMHFKALFEYNPDAPSNPSNNPNNANTYTLVYMIDGQVCHSEYLPEGATISAITTPKRKGYSFSGWEDVPTVMPNHNLTLKGSFIINKYEVIYVIDSVEVHREEVEYNARLVPPTLDEREGHTLVWKNIPSVMPDYPIMVEGYYSPNIYKLTYLLDGNVYKSIDVTFGTSITPEYGLTKEGYTFSGWNGEPETMPATDVTVIGSFTINKYKVTYIVDREVLHTDSITYGSKVIAIDVPRKDGHTFSGWKDIPETMPANDITVQGEYIVILGDVNRSGVVDIADAIGLVNYILGKSTFIINEEAADVNQDGTVNIADAISIVNNILNQN